MRKTIFTVGFAAGYVLGARAGRSRYEAIARMAGRVRSSQTVQSAAGVISAQAGSVLHSARAQFGGRPPLRVVDDLDSRAS